MYGYFCTTYVNWFAQITGHRIHKYTNTQSDIGLYIYTHTHENHRNWLSARYHTFRIANRLFGNIKLRKNKTKRTKK